MSATMRYFKLDDLQQIATVSVEEAAHLLGVSRSHAYALVAKGEFFETIKVGKTRRILARPLYLKLAGSVADVA
jgi:excisionase family DNA binding protein